MMGHLFGTKTWLLLLLYDGTQIDTRIKLLRFWVLFCY